MRLTDQKNCQPPAPLKFLGSSESTVLDPASDVLQQSDPVSFIVCRLLTTGDLWDNYSCTNEIANVMQEKKT